MSEYAKLAKVEVKARGRGMQARVRLPDKVKFTSDSGNFINFYCGMGQYECGLSTAVGRPGWRWFVNSLGGEGNGGGTFGEFQNGEQVTIKLTLNNATGQTEFWVNGQCKYVFSRRWSEQTGFDNCRFIFGALTAQYNGQTLPPWGSWHTLAVANSLMYKDAAKVWRPLERSVATVSAFHWPSGVQCPDPQDYMVHDETLNCGAVSAELWCN